MISEAEIRILFRAANDALTEYFKMPEVFTDKNHNTVRGTLFIVYTIPVDYATEFLRGLNFAELQLTEKYIRLNALSCKCIVDINASTQEISFMADVQLKSEIIDRMLREDNELISLTLADAVLLQISSETRVPSAIELIENLIASKVNLYKDMNDIINSPNSSS